MSSQHFIVQISDTHLLSARNEVFNGVMPYVNLKNVLEHVENLNEKPKLIILSGDNSQDGSVESYKLLKSLLDTIKTKYYIFPGNHDDINNMNKVFGFSWDNESADSSVIFQNWHIYILNSSRHPKEAGELSKKQLDKFNSELLKYKDKPTIVFLHHQPVNVNSAWIDRLSLNNPNDFNNLVGKNTQIKAVLFGHIHHVFEKIVGKIFYASAPSTVYQVFSNREDFTIENRVPGYRLIELEENKFNSRVIWVK